MNIEELELLLKEGEGLAIEFKERFSSKLDKDIVAFANTGGGRIFLGVNDQGGIVGEALTNGLKAKINSLARNCEPSISIQKIDQVKDVVVITIFQSDQKPHSCSAGYFRRLDAATQKMNQQELKVLFSDSDNKPKFENIINADVTWEDISISKIETFLSEANIQINSIESQQILNSLRLADGPRIKNAGVLFFANNPRKFISPCEMILVAFKGSSGVHIYDRMDIQDDLITQFNQAILFLRKHLNVRSEIKEINREDIYEIPIAALREAVANAIIHRDYAVSGTSLMVEVHEDKVVIKNPGQLPEGLDIASLMRISIRRNELIADIFSRIDRAERIGSGLRRIMELTAKAELSKPIIENNLFFSITFKRDKQLTSATVYPDVKQIDTDELSERQVDMLRILEGKKLAPNKIMSALETPISARTLRRELQTLKDKGYIDAEGPKGWDRKWFILRK